MKTSNCSEDGDAECGEGPVSPGEVMRTVEVHRAAVWGVALSDDDAIRETVSLQVGGSERFVSAEDLSIQRMETQRQKWKESQASLASSEVSVQREERWSDTRTSPPSDRTGSPPGMTGDADTGASDAEPAALCEPTGDLYYTASSEVSLLSDTELPEKLQPEIVDKEEEGKECVMAGHVAAMRERFESMTRANTPCPDTMRSSSPSLDVFRNITPSPDLLG